MAPRSDLRRFRDITLGHPVVMGRKTSESIGRPLPGRTSIVITRDRGFAARGVVTAADLDAALAAARGDAWRRGVADIMIIGGADLYGQTIELRSGSKSPGFMPAPPATASFRRSIRRAGASRGASNILPVRTTTLRSPH